MSSNIHFVLAPLPSSDDQINDRLKDTAEKMNRGSIQSPSAFNAVKQEPVRQCVVGPSYIGLLFEDGRVARVSYNVFAERLDMNGDNANKPTGHHHHSGGSGGGNGGIKSTQQTGSSTGIVRRSSHVVSATMSNPPPTGGASSASSSARRTARGLLRAAARGRGSSSVIHMGSRSVVPAQFVPEDLIAQAQMVLQGKSRSVIVRELQRTNLDVNLAVNNLLSRDDEESEDMDDSQDPYMPGEELISLLDAGIAANDHSSVVIDGDAVFNEDLFTYSPIRMRQSRLPRSGSSSGDRDHRDSSAPERESAMLRFTCSSSAPRSRQWLEYALRDSGSAETTSKSLSASQAAAGSSSSALPLGMDASSSSSKKKTDNQPLNPLYVAEQLEFWPGDKRFSSICSLHSELVAISTSGQLHQWRWNDSDPYKNQISEGIIIYHPKTINLAILNERIIMLTGSCVRCSIVTESNKIATWIDESIAGVASKLEHPAQVLVDVPTGDRISAIFACSLYTCVRLESGSIFWWGIAPFSHRKKVWEKLRAKSKKHKSSSSSSNNSPEIVTGCQVSQRNAPSYHHGAIGFTTSGGIPKVGTLQADAWNVNDSCTFKLMSQSDLRKMTHNIYGTPTVSKSSSTSNAGVDYSVLRPDAPASPSLTKNTSQERLEMPPPPSPASSTCSEPGASPVPKRSKRIATPIREEEKKDTEMWPLKDVVFLEDVKNVPVGRVIKVDGNYAAVRFHCKNENPADAVNQLDNILNECRLLRKDELQLVKGSNSNRTPDCFQRLPRKVCIPESTNIVTMSISNQGIHAIVKNKNKLHYVLISVTSGKVDKNWTFPTEPSAFNGNDPSLIQLQSTGENEVTTILRDGNGSIYPIAKDCTESIKEPINLDLGPAQAIGIGINPIRDYCENQKNQILVMVLCMEEQLLTSSILKSDADLLRATLNHLETNSFPAQIVIGERVDQNRNILHTAVSACCPTSNRTGVDLNDDVAHDVVSISELVLRRSQPMKRSNPLAVNDSDSEMGDSSSQGPDRDTWSPAGKMDPSADLPFMDANEQKSTALTVLWTLTESTVMAPFLKDLLFAKDSQGHTPFMLAVKGRAYSAALHLLNVARRVTNEQPAFPDSASALKFFMSMIFPRGSNPDDSPLHVVCYNDTCSFTWTGAEHINQDIFECKTCGLTGSLCCCSECARVCHKGHDCKLKKTSPTAYCDCWEKCKCKALIQGSQTARNNLLKKLIHETDLVTIPNSRGENILLSLVQTVGRQINEQRQYRPSRPRTGFSRKAPENRDPEQPELPDHDLEPPRFSRKALDKLLSNWEAVKAMILSGYRGDNNEGGKTGTEDQTFLRGQNGTALLDKFVHCLLFKVGNEMLDSILTCMTNQSAKCSNPEVKLVIQRFVRSVIRISVTLCMELSPTQYATVLGPSANPVPPSFCKRGSLVQLMKCRRIFQSLLYVSIEELCEMAESLISPVRLGVARPSAAFTSMPSITDAIGESEDLFSIDPMYNSSNEESSDATAPLDDPGAQSDRIIDHPPPSVSIADEDVGDPVEGDNEADQDAIPMHEDDVSALVNDMVQDAPDSGSDSDSDSNPDDASYMSNVDAASAQRSTMTGATAGSDAGIASLAFFSEDDSAESSNAEDEEESEAAETEPDTEDFPFEEGLSARTNPGNTIGSAVAAASVNLGSGTQVSVGSRGPRHNLAHYLQLQATRQRFANANAPSLSSSSRMPPNQIMQLTETRSRRPEMTGEPEPISMTSTCVNLSRAFAIVIRQMSSLFPLLLADRSQVTPTESVHLINYIEKRLRPTWDWLVTVMDSTEGQLRFGCSLTNSPFTGSTRAQSRISSRDPRQPFMSRRAAVVNASMNGGSRTGQPPPVNTMDNVTARQDFLSYMVSLMRSHNNEHYDSLPILDVAALKHVAYVFDAFIVYMRSGSETDSNGNGRGIETITIKEDFADSSENEGDDQEDSFVQVINSPNFPPDEDSSLHLSQNTSSSNSSNNNSSSSKGKKHIFFQRSESTLYLGCPPPDPFADGIAEALPLADQPHILSATSRREELFGVPRTSVFTPNPLDGDSSSQGQDTFPSKISLSRRHDYLDLAVRVGDVEMADSNEWSAHSSSPSTRSQTSVIVHAGSMKKSSDKEEGADGEPQPGTSGQDKISGMDHSHGQCKTKTASLIGNRQQHDALLLRWRLLLEIFGRIFIDDVGLEPKSVMNDLGGFPVKESKFRREMEKLRGTQNRDIIFKVERERDKLIQEVFKTLNQTHQQQSRRINNSGPSLVMRVKVTFFNEPGEGTGVSRSFYTSFAEAILSQDKLPPLSGCLVGNRNNSIIHRLKCKEKDSSKSPSSYSVNRAFHTRSSRSSERAESRVDREPPMRPDAPPYYIPGTEPPGLSHSEYNQVLSPHRQQLGLRLYPRVSQIRPTLAPRITGMLLELAPARLLSLFSNEEMLKMKIEEAAALIRSHERDINLPQATEMMFDGMEVFALGRSSSSASSMYQDKNTTGSSSKISMEPEEEEEEDNAPLFYQPGMKGFYSPRQGRATPERLNAFRNVGRIIGLCLLQNELCPIQLNRHVLKFILKRNIAWHDLAFFDPFLYDSLRTLVVEGENSQSPDLFYQNMALLFQVDLSPEEGGGQVDLIPNGRNTEVNASNIYDYVRKYSEQKMVKSQERALTNLRMGIFDILPQTVFEGLMAEDLRLLLNGVGEINVQQLMSYTTFNYESSEGGTSEHTASFKKWFWSIMEKMTTQEKQDLVYFWTGSPALPASEDGFQPMPTVTIRPADDQHFPTANTCISRLYIPLYTSKSILKNKLLLAIKVKNFGFV